MLCTEPTEVTTGDVFSKRQCRVEKKSIVTCCGMVNYIFHKSQQQARGHIPQLFIFDELCKQRVFHTDRTVSWPRYSALLHEGARYHTGIPQYAHF